MIDKGNFSKKRSIDLFLRKRDPKKMPERGISLPRIDYTALEEITKRRDEYQKEQDEIFYPLMKAKMESLGITKEQWDKIGEQEDAVYKKRRDNESGNVPQFFYKSELPEMILCRYVTVLECQKKVCVDQPVPFDVDEFWFEGGGNTTSRSGPNFNGNCASYYAIVEGSSYRDWGMYHRRIKESRGSIKMRASTELVEQAKIRSVGVNFLGELYSPSGGMVNGLYLDGQIFITVVNSFGEGSQTITWQVSIEPPGGSLTRYVPSSQQTFKYNDPPRAYQNYADPYLDGGSYRKLPPARKIDINQTFPEGTFILVEVEFSHWIKACGKESFASIWHDFCAQPYINLEACSWQW